MEEGDERPELLERLKLIKELQSEGLKLEGIKRLLGDSGDKILALRRAGTQVDAAMFQQLATSLAGRR